jgi:phosphoglycolate phosphatase-like HAD superfamily hydrolase
VRLLVLDFDGVISDSAPEAFEVAWRTYRDLRPESRLARVDRAELYRGFLALMPFGNRAEDYGAALAALDDGTPLPDQDGYDAYRAARDEAWLHAYHRRFYEVRTALSEHDREAWLALLRPYRPFVALLRHRAGTCPYAIATAKDRRSVDLLLAAYGIADLFAPERVLDKETGVSKSAHLEQLARREGLAFSDLTFVDDKVNHLDSAAPLGVRCALAAWGYNGPREHDLARARGYLVCGLEDAGARLFGS